MYDVCAARQTQMDNQEGQSSVNGGVGQQAGQGIPAVGGNIDRLIEALTTFAERQAAAMEGNTNLLEKFKRLFPTVSRHVPENYKIKGIPAPSRDIVIKALF